jgi:hypothetical protein
LQYDETMPGDFTVFQGTGENAEEQANYVRDMLNRAGMNAEIYDDSAPGVAEGVFEVRVPDEQRDDALQLIESERDVIPGPLDLSHELDMVPVFVSEAPDAEMIATEVRSILEAQGIPSLLVSGSMFPNLPFEVRVPRIRFDDARRAIAAAEEAGPTAAEEAERESEASGANPPED